MRNRLKEVAVEVHRRSQAAEVARASLMGLRVEFELMLFSRESQTSGMMLVNRESQASFDVSVPIQSGNCSMRLGIFTVH